MTPADLCRSLRRGGAIASLSHRSEGTPAEWAAWIADDETSHALAGSDARWWIFRRSSTLLAAVSSIGSPAMSFLHSGGARGLCCLSIALAVSGCADPGRTRADQHVSDEQRCSSYGYVPGTDAFAGCMMHRDEKRENQRDRDQAKLDRIRQKSLDRSGDTRFPICSAANMDAQLDTAGNFWYAEGCRAR